MKVLFKKVKASDVHEAKNKINKKYKDAPYVHIKPGSKEGTFECEVHVREEGDSKEFVVFPVKEIDSIGSFRRKRGGQNNASKFV